MSGWSPADKYIEEMTGSEFPAVNNITIYGQLPSDQVPTPTRSRTLVQAHMKSLRLFRKWCRYMPMIVTWQNMNKYTTPEKAKLQLAAYYRQHNRVRSIENIDEFVRNGYERLYNIQQLDVIGVQILDHIAPIGRENIQENQGFSYHDDVKHKDKSPFLKDFLQSKKRPQY
ncbi:UNKNOWN [Stylonychia lemnae]|uniref:Uncharacterized protein n=1 Tax=Stylonychia lemnae TaxID=5949 RepID=A0A078B932_STYLE|nr:UNKNOWN [Stylonychia lemnae]|eukprot:CDW90879.1 UNKNOWN [Stylonychia lemnae]